MRRGLLLVAFGTLVEAWCALPAASVELQPGLWELTGTIDRDGTVSARSPRLRCVTPEAAGAARAGAGFDLGAGARAALGARFGRDACRLTEAVRGETLVTWRLQCGGDPGAEQVGTVRFDGPRHYTLTIRTSLTAGARTVTSVLTAEGRHKGECPR